MYLFQSPYEQQFQLTPLHVLRLIKTIFLIIFNHSNVLSLDCRCDVFQCIFIPGYSEHFFKTLHDNSVSVGA
jgi:hypothetical protein